MKKVICTNCDDWQNCREFNSCWDQQGWLNAVKAFCEFCPNRKEEEVEVKDSPEFI